MWGAAIIQMLRDNKRWLYCRDGQEVLKLATQAAYGTEYWDVLHWPMDERNWFEKQLDKLVSDLANEKCLNIAIGWSK